MSLFSSLEATVKAAYAASFSKKKEGKRKRLREKNENRRTKTSNKENDRTLFKYLNVLHRNRTQK